MWYDNLDHPALIAFAFGKLYLPSNWKDGMTASVAERPKFKKRLAYTSPLTMRDIMNGKTSPSPFAKIEESCAEQYAKETRAGASRGIRAQQELNDAMEIVRAVLSLPSDARLWALFAYTDSFNHLKLIVAKNVLKELQSREFDTSHWHGDWENIHKLYAVIQLLVGAKTQPVSKRLLAHAAGLQSEKSFRDGSPWHELVKAVGAIKQNWYFVVSDYISAAIVRLDDGYGLSELSSAGNS